MAKSRPGPTVIKPDGRKVKGPKKPAKKLVVGEGRSLPARPRDDEGRALAGRPSGYSLGVHRALCDAVRLGMSEQAAEAKAGLSRRTLRYWREKASKGDKAMIALFLDLDLAEADFEGKYINPLVQASEYGDVKAALGLASLHMNRQKVAETQRLRADMQKIEVQVNDRAISVQVATMSIETLEEIAGLNGTFVDAPENAE